jgi:hypothetical protein
LIYPKPTSFYQSPKFEGDRGSPVYPAPRDDQPVVLGVDKPLGERVMAQLDLVTFRRFGRLRGDHVFLNRGCLALDRSGTPIRLNYDPEEDGAHNSVFNQFENLVLTEDFFTVRDTVLERWDAVQVVADIPVLSEWYAANNYYHFMIRFLPQIRRYPDEEGVSIGVPEELLARPFQRDLLTRVMGQRKIVPLPGIFRARNPTLSYEPISKDGIGWLKKSTGLRARKGERRVYIQRGASMVGRKGGDIADTPEFRSFLERNGFEVISFGGGELSLADQVALLDGACVVLGAHGAGLTNIVFLDPGVAVIELFARHWCYHTHMALSMYAGLKHTSVICDIDANLNAIPDANDLRLALERSLDVTA